MALKDGYYLSTYVSIDPLQYLIDFSTRGDQNLSLWKVTGQQVELIQYWELERVTGLKGHDRAFFNEDHARTVINELLSDRDLSLDDMVEIWGTSALDTCDDYHSLSDYPEFTYHSIAHLFSALLIDTEHFYNSNILALAVDGGPDGVVDKEIRRKSYYSGCYTENGKVIDMFHINSPGPIWAGSKSLFKMREGTLMALTSATRTECANVSFDKGEAWDSDSASLAVKEVKQFSETLRTVLQNETISVVNGYDLAFTDEENYISMFMKEIDKRSVAMMEETIQTAINKHQIDPANTYLTITGGYALNCPANSHLMTKFGFKGFIAPPCVNDGGLSLGIALYAFHKKMTDHRFSFVYKNAYHGDSESLSADELLQRYGKFIKSIETANPDQIVEDLVNAPVVWFQGKAEMGPRALGNRSILGDSTSINTKDELNRIKEREWWRPVAPIILEEELDAWFENAYPSPYMLHTFDLRADKKNTVAAIEHIDGSCRVQTVSAEQNPLLHAVLQAMKKKTGVPILCNTSLNDKGEPIINRVEEAMNFALRKRLKIAYVNGFRLELTAHEQFEDTEPAKRRFDHLGWLSHEEKDEWLAKLNPFNVPKDQLGVYMFTPDLHDRIDLTKRSDVRTLAMLTDIARKNHPHVVAEKNSRGCS